MSQTFFIKNTAFDDNTNDIQIREDNSFIIGPGELNGPGGVNRESDLELYGFGAIKWGEGVDQNQYRMLESHACLAKETGDFLPGTDIDDENWVPGAGSYVVGVSPLLPKDERDLGLGNGITAPLVGQVWYNLTDQTMYNYDLSHTTPAAPLGSPPLSTEFLVWKTIFEEVNDSLIFHELRRDLHLTSLQNTFLDGLDLPTLLSYDVNQLVGMGDSQGVTNVQGQLNLMVEKAGDIMTGDLRMDVGNVTLDSGSQLWFEGGHHRITNNDGGGNFNIRVGNEYNSGTLYTQTGGAATININHEGVEPSMRVSLGNGFTNTVGQPVTFSGIFDFTNDGNLSVNATDHPVDQNLITKLYSDNRYVNNTGDAMTGTLNLNTSDALTFENGDHRITYNDGGGNFNIRVGHLFDGADNRYTSNEAAIHMNFNHVTTNPSVILTISDGVHTINDVVNWSGSFTFNKESTITASGLATAGTHLMNRNAADTRYLNVSGDSMSSNADITFVGGGEVLGLPATPSGTTAASSKAYTDLKAPIASPTLTGTPRSVTPTAGDNSTKIATTAFVSQNGLTKAEVSNMLRTQDESDLFGAGGWNQFLGTGACFNSGYYNYLSNNREGNTNDLGLWARNTWHDLYYVTATFIPGGSWTSSETHYARDSNYTYLARITNYTSDPITWQFRGTYWFATDDTGYFRVLENNSTNIVQWSKAPAARCLLYNKAAANSGNITLSRTIPAGQTYTYRWQGYITGGWDSGGDAMMPRSVEYNKIVF